MGQAGINSRVLAQNGGQVYCFMADADVAATAKAAGTRSVASMDEAAQLQVPCIFAIGNAPTAPCNYLR